MSDYKFKAPCHSRCGTIKIPPPSTARPWILYSVSHSSAMVTSPYDWKILQWDVKQYIVLVPNIHVGHNDKNFGTIVPYCLLRHTYAHYEIQYPSLLSLTIQELQGKFQVLDKTGQKQLCSLIFKLAHKKELQCYDNGWQNSCKLS
jgi:hypothetical protein